MQIRYFWVAVVHCRSFLLAAVLPRTTSTTNTTTVDDVVWALSYNCLFVLNSARLATHLWLQVDEHTDWSTILTPPPRRRSRNLHFIIPQQLLFRKKWLIIPTKHFFFGFIVANRHRHVGILKQLIGRRLEVGATPPLSSTFWFSSRVEIMVLRTKNFSAIKAIPNTLLILTWVENDNFQKF